MDNLLNFWLHVYIHKSKDESLPIPERELWLEAARACVPASAFSEALDSPEANPYDS